MPKLILFVDDDPTLRILGSRQFESLGWGLELASDGSEAVTKAQEGYQLILMDIHMPVMDGIEATIKIRELEVKNGLKRTPIIAMTAYSERQRALMAGMDDYIQKPVLLATVKQLIERWLPDESSSA